MRVRAVRWRVRAASATIHPTTHPTTHVLSLTPPIMMLCADCKIFTEMLIRLMVGKGLGVYDSDLEGGYKSWSKDVTHRREAQVHGIHRDIWLDRGGSLPWRLTKDELREADRRMKRTVWPHYVDRLFYDGCSFWVKPGRLWKTRRKVCIL